LKPEELKRNEVYTNGNGKYRRIFGMYYSKNSLRSVPVAKEDSVILYFEVDTAGTQVNGPQQRTGKGFAQWAKSEAIL